MGAGVARRRSFVHTLYVGTGPARLGTARYSLVQRYLQFINEQGLSADGLVEASEEQADALEADSDLALFATRQRDMHDLWHVLTEYGRDELGEACLLSFTYAQNKNRGVGFIAFVGCFKLYRRHGLSAARSIFSAYLDGRRAAWLPLRSSARP